MHDLEIDGHRVQLEVDTDPARPGAGRAADAAGVRSLTSQPPTLEDLFLRHYGDRIEPVEEGVAT